MTRGAHSPRIVLLGLSIAVLACNLTSPGPSPTPPPSPSATPEAEAVFPDPQREAFEALTAASSVPPVVNIVNGFPRSVTARAALEGDTPSTQALAFLDRYQDLYRLRSPDLALGVEDVQEGPPPVVTLFQTYRGLPVYGGELTVILGADGTLTTIGELLTADVELDVVPGLTENEALDIARAHLGEPAAPRLGPSRLVIYDPSLFDGVASEPHLAWQLRLGTPPYEYFVDARRGAVLAAHDLEEAFPAAHSSDWALDLEDANGTNGMDTGCYWWTDEDDEIGDEDGLYGNYSSSSAAFLVWQGAKEAYSFFHNTFGRHSFDGDDIEVEFYVDATIPKNNIIARTLIGDIGCDLVEYDTDEYPVSDGIITHEFTHGVIAYTSNFANSGQPDALNESYADIMGIWDTKDWTFDGLVDRENLSLHFDDYDPGADEHDNGAIFTTAFSYIVNGFDLADIGFDGFHTGDGRVASLYYLTMVFLNSSASFMDARDLTLAFADDVGFSQDEVCNIQNAFYATGIGYPDFDCDGVSDTPDKDNDSIDDVYDNCPDVFNGAQEDSDDDGDGDACDKDRDGDGVPNTEDNCVDVPNSDQENKDLDNLGKACDPNEDEDFDDDTILNEDDNCPFDPNTDQADVDDDGDGDACDPDTDADGISNDDDNCPFTANADQANADGDGAGDACDPCSTAGDVDAWTTGIPELGIDPKPFVPDSDEDGIPDACDRTPTLDNQPWTVAIDGLVPGGPPLPGEAEGRPGGILALPLPVCPPGDGHAHGASDRQRLMLTGLSDQVRAWVTDGGGDPKQGAPDPGDTRMINFQPQGGEAYFLALQFGPEWKPDPPTGDDPGQDEQFQLALFCEGRDEQDRWTPTPSPTPTATATPTVTSSWTPTITATPSPTVYVRPTLTPTPAPTRRLIILPTATR